MSNGHASAEPTPEVSADITLSRDALAALIEQAVDRAVAKALQSQPKPITQTFGNAEAAMYVYRLPNCVERWRQLRIAYPELDAASVGTGTARCWTREALDAFLDKHPQFRRRAQKAAREQQVAA